MAQLRVNIPEELKEEIEQLGDSSLLIRRLLIRELQKMHELKSVIGKSQLTERDVEELTNKVEMSLTDKFERSLKE